MIPGGIVRLRIVLVGLIQFAVLVTAGCGFYLRGTAPISQEIKTLILESQDFYGPLTRAIEEQLHLNGVTIIKDTKRKDVPSLRIITARETQDTASIFLNGKAAEYQIALIVEAQVLLPGQNPNPLSVSTFRLFFDDPLTALAKSSEKEIIYQEMRDQVAQKLVYKLLAVNTEKAVTHRQSIITDKKSTSNAAP